METVDVAVIGAGPAGSTLAALLAGRGLTVAIIDRDLLPRDKVCGEFLSYDAIPILERLGVVEQIDAAGAPNIHHCRVIGSRRIYEFRFPHAARGVSRMLLDDLLLRTAERNGAIRLDGWTAIELSPDRRRVVIEREGERRDVNARVIAGAWGRWGRFDQQLNRSFVRDRTHRNFGFKRHYIESSATARPSTSIDLYSFRSGYLGVSAVESGTTNICGLVHESRLTEQKGRWEGFVETIRTENDRLDTLYATHEPVQDRFLSSEPVIFRARSPAENGVFMVGDASGLIDPLTGNGMAMAVQSAMIAAPLIAEAVTRPEEGSRIEDEYRRQHASWFGPRIAWSRTAAHLLSRPRLLDFALATTRSESLGELFLRRTRADRGQVARLADAWFC